MSHQQTGRLLSSINQRQLCYNGIKKMIDKDELYGIIRIVVILPCNENSTKIPKKREVIIPNNPFFSEIKNFPQDEQQKYPISNEEYKLPEATVLITENNLNKSGLFPIEFEDTIKSKTGKIDSSTPKKRKYPDDFQEENSKSPKIQKQSNCGCKTYCSTQQCGCKRNNLFCSNECLCTKDNCKNRNTLIIL